MHKLIPFIGIFFILCGVTNGHIFRRDYFYDQDVGGWLKFNSIPATWEQAVLSCHYEGAILASPINEDISKAIATILFSHGVTTMFTGISNTNSYSEYQSMEGVPLSNLCISWAAEINATTLTSEYYSIAMNANGTSTAVPYNSGRLPFTCYKEEGIKLNKCGPVDNGYVLNNQTGYCYKVFEKKEIWTSAFKICAKEGGHLAIVNSEAEAKVIWELAKNAFNETEDNGLKYVSIGFRAWDEPRTWITVHGQSLKDAGYDKWASGQPSDPNERCGSLYAGGAFEDGVLNDAKCLIERKFICEIDPKIGGVPYL